MRTDLEALKKFTKDELVMRVEKLENSNTRLTSELQELLIETKDVKVNGYTNIQTYRLCLVLDNEPTECSYNPLERFFYLVSDEEFEMSDINLINWNEVIERYSDRLVEGYKYKYQV